MLVIRGLVFGGGLIFGILRCTLSISVFFKPLIEPISTLKSNNLLIQPVRQDLRFQHLTL